VAARAASPSPSPRVSDLDMLMRVRRAAERRTAAERELVTAMQEARELGLSFARIGDAVGVSAPAVRQRLLRA
jgi:DNA-directed RNA polymerase specialized sigma24 family protein